MSDNYPPEDLTAFQRDILHIVRQLGDPHGLAIKQELEGLYSGNINHGRLYPNMDQLVEKGLVEKGQKDRRTNWYKITKRGERTLDSYVEWMQSEQPVSATAD